MSNVFLRSLDKPQTTAAFDVLPQNIGPDKLNHAHRRDVIYETHHFSSEILKRQVHQIGEPL